MRLGDIASGGYPVFSIPQPNIPRTNLSLSRIDIKRTNSYEVRLTTPIIKQTLTH